MPAVPNRPARAGRLVLIGAGAVILAACASAPDAPAPRSKLNTYELRSMRPEMLLHTRCVQQKAIEYAGGTDDVKLIADTAIAQCQGTLAAFRERLREFNLTDEAQRRYMVAVQIASKNVLTDQLLRARKAARQSPAHGEGVSL